MKFIKHKNIWFSISGTLLLASVLVWIAFGLNLGIDFTGGSLLEVEYVNVERPPHDDVVDMLSDMNLSLSVSATGENGYLFRFRNVNETTHKEILDRLRSASIDNTGDAVISGSDATNSPYLDELRFDSIGPVIGKELQRKSLYALFAVLIAIVLYIAYAFRKISYPVSSWKYGIVAIVTLFHDILLTVGIFVLLGHFMDWEVNTPFIAALLTILGYSVNDTIVIFDRIRENLHRHEGSFEEIVERSVKDTVARSLNTSITTLLVLIAIFFFGGVTIQSFVLALIVGIALGTYSSIFIASPLLVIWQQISWKLKKGK